MARLTQPGPRRNAIFPGEFVEVKLMFERSECPECGGWDTERVFVDWWQDEVRETRICNDCPCQYTIAYGDPIVEVDEVEA